MRSAKADPSLTTPKLCPKEHNPLFGDPAESAWGPRSLSDCLDCQGWVDGKAENDVAVFLFPTTSTTAAD